MEKISTATRIHPLMAAAAVSVIAVSIAGTAAITGLLPSSQARSATPAAAAVSPELQLAQAQQLLAAQQLASQPPLAASLAPVAAPAPVRYAALDTPAAERPVVRRAVAKPKVQTRRVAYREPARQAPRYDSTPDYRASAPAPAPRKPSYVGIGTGAVIGGLIGNQIGGGNGKKLATLAGVIGGGYLGNEIAQRNQR